MQDELKTDLISWKLRLGEAKKLGDTALIRAAQKVVDAIGEAIKVVEIKAASVVERAQIAREAGRRALEATNSTGMRCKNIHGRDSLMAYCWEAGYRQDVRSAEQLIHDYAKSNGSWD